MDQEKKRLWIWPAVIAAVLLVLAAAVWLGRSTYRNYKERRSLTQAQAFMERGDYRNALLSARQALQLNPTNVPACRIMATLADLSHSPAVLDWQRRIVQAEPSPANQLLLAAAALRYQTPPFPLTTQILAELSATNLPGYQVVAASLAISLRRLDEAETHFELAAKLDPTNQLYALNLAIIQLSSTNETQAAAARARLETLAADGNLGPPALRALLVDRLGHQAVAAAKDYSTRLLASSQATLADRLQHLEILQRLKDADFAPQLQTMQRQAATNAPVVAEVSAWMQTHELLAEDLQWLTNLPVGIQARPPVRLALANGYLQGEDWRTLRDFASKGNWEDMDFLRLALISRAWFQLGVPQVAASNWGSAVNETGNRYAALTTLLGLAERWQLPREQEDLLQRIIQKFPRERWARQKLEQFYLTDGDTPALNQLYTQWLGLFPDDVGCKNNLAATCLLLQTNLPQAYRWAEEVYAQATNDLFVTSTYAFALHLQGRTKAGLELMQKLDDRSLRQPAAALYYGVLLAALNETNQAAPFLKIAATNPLLLPEEKRLLSAALGDQD